MKNFLITLGVTSPLTASIIFILFKYSYVSTTILIVGLIGIVVLVGLFINGSRIYKKYKTNKEIERIKQSDIILSYSNSQINPIHITNGVISKNITITGSQNTIQPFKFIKSLGITKINANIILRDMNLHNLDLKPLVDILNGSVLCIDCTFVDSLRVPESINLVSVEIPKYD